jgi:hypothetical protein
MENQNSTKQNCGCSDGCCAPQKKGKLWKRALFIIILLAAGTIITVKLIAKQNTPAESCCSTSETPACCAQPASGSTPAATPQPPK